MSTHSQFLPLCDSGKAWSLIHSQPRFLRGFFYLPKDVWGLETVGQGNLSPERITPLPGKSKEQGQRCPTGGPTAVPREGWVAQG